MRCCNTNSPCLLWLQGIRPSVVATWIILGVVWSSCGVARSQTVYTEDFGTSSSNAELESVGWGAWYGAGAVYCGETTGEMYIFPKAGSSAGPYFTSGAKSSAIGIATTTEPGAIHASLLQSISFQANNKVAKSEVRIAVQTASGWYVSDVYKDLNQGWGPVTTFTFDGDASNWSGLNFTPGSTLSIGGAAGSDLGGNVLAFGFYVDANPGGGPHADYIMRLDDYTVTSLTARYWDTSADAGIQAGDGTWDTNNTARWSETTAGSDPLGQWTSSNHNAHFYASGASTVTVGSGVGANSLIFSGTGYTLGGQRVTVGAGGIVADESAAISGGIALGASQSVTVAAGKTLTIGGQTTVPTGMVWTKEGEGTMTAGQINVGAGSGYTHAAGTLNVSGSGVVLTGGAGADAVATQTGGTINGTGSWIIFGGSGGPTSGTGNKAIFNLEAGTLNAPTLYVGHHSDMELNQTDGAISVNVLAVGSDDGYGRYFMKGGTLDVVQRCRMGYKDTATAEFVQSGGSVTFDSGGWLQIGGEGDASYTINTNDGASTLTVGGNLFVAELGSSTSTFDIEGGTVSIGGNLSIAKSADAIGTVTQTGGGVTIASDRAMQFGPGNATYNLDGGTLKLANVSFANAAKNLLAFGGGTLEHNGATLMTTAVPVEFKAGGGIIHTPGAGADVQLTGPLTGSGSLTKTGDGILTLSGASQGYTGALDVDGGTLLVNASLAGSSGASVASGATLGGTGTIGGLTSIADGGVLATGASIGTLTFGGDLTLAGGAIWDWEFVDNTLGNYDQAVGEDGKLILPTAGAPAITLNILGDDTGHSVNWYDEFTIFAGDVENFDAGLFDLVNDSDWTRGWRIFSDGQDLVLTAVPEPGVLGMLAMALLVLLALGRSRKQRG